jgi:hypothetical protein
MCTVHELRERFKFEGSAGNSSEQLNVEEVVRLIDGNPSSFLFGSYSDMLNSTHGTPVYRNEGQLKNNDLQQNVESGNDTKQRRKQYCNLIQSQFATQLNATISELE